MRPTPAFPATLPPATPALRALLLSSAALCAIMAAAPRAEAKDAYIAAVRTCIDAAGKNADANCAAGSTSAAQVPVWSFVQITAAEFGAKKLSTTLISGAVVPGPLLTADSGDASGLTIHLLNLLPVPVSLVIPGQPAPLIPVWFDPVSGSVTGTGTRTPGDVTSRVRSLNTETAPGATGDYKWGTLKPGSFIYESGTHQAIQVQMGLHGGLVVASGTSAAGGLTGTAYPAAAAAPAVTYARQVVTYLSEIDGAMHATVDGSPTHDAVPRSAPAGTKVSPLEYWPNQFLTTQTVLNPDFTVVAAVGGHGRLLPNAPALMRFMNGSLRSHVQIVQDANLGVVAEDGNPYRYPRQQYSVLLDAGKTKDALFTPVIAETVAVYDRMLNTGGLGASKQGMVAYLDITSPNTPTAVSDAYTATQGQVLSVAAPGVLANDTSPDAKALTAKVVTTTANGTLALALNGGFTYTPAAGSTATSDSFSYAAMEGTAPVLTSLPATVRITLSAAAPVAVADSYNATNTAPLVVAKPGVLANDTPVGTTLTAALDTGPAHGTLTLNADGSFNYAAASGYTGADAFTYTASNGTSKSVAGTVTVNVTGNPLVASNDWFVVAVGSSGNLLSLILNDTGWVAADTLTIVSKPNHGGTVSVGTNGAVRYTPKVLFIGTEAFTYRFSTPGTAPKTSNTATVTVNVTR